MSEWWTYGVSDLLLFSPRTYVRLLESYNRAVWPGHLPALLAGIAALVLVARRGQANARWVAAILAAAWLWVAWAFHLQRYASINWAAKWFALGFGVEALLLIWLGVIRGSLRFETDSFRAPGLAITAYAMFVHPWIPLLAGRSYASIEIFGVLPDPTAIATAGIALLAAVRVQWTLLVIPVVWCAISGATSSAMDTRDAAVTPAVAALVVAIAVWNAIRARRPGSIES